MLSNYVRNTCRLLYVYANLLQFHVNCIQYASNICSAAAQESASSKHVSTELLDLLDEFMVQDLLTKNKKSDIICELKLREENSNHYAPVSWPSLPTTCFLVDRKKLNQIISTLFIFYCH